MRAISSMATRHVLADLVAAAAAVGLPAIEVESVGGIDAAELVAAGEPLDLVLLAAGALERLAREGHVDAATVTPIVLSQVAVAVTAGRDERGARPEGAAFADAAALRDALCAVERIGYSTGPSGVALVRMIEQWGLAAELGDRLVQARPGVPVARSLADGDVDLGFQQLSELVGQPGVRVLGVMPDDCAIDTVFAGAVATVSADPGRAADVLSFFASDAVAAIKTDHAFGVPA
ncbi:molybdenum ABC transporter substrate-binding protein [Microbacterium sp. Y-01]|uniref:substrate-binding domain-containing protein n=1 Tax=Microbacterium sp. Y-01 TaxID=2048898 RepID=UPI000F5E6C50|nr:substrate-binding domain-containing protein [Microbacterium sp. Y-01]AZH79011.1 molybdenum ABC transporter substrate-binding protein [Microbacterium sp. Y-01]